MRKKIIDMIKTIVDNDEVVSTWSVHISKYGNKDIVARKAERMYDQKFKKIQYHFSHPLTADY